MRTPAARRSTLEDETAAIQRRADLERQLIEEAARQEEAAARLSAELKTRKDVPVEDEKQQPSRVKRVAGEVMAVGTAGVLAGAARLGKEVGYGASAVLTAVETSGHQTLKKFEVFLKWIPFLGPWLLKKPEKSWKERDQEQQKKDEAAAKKKKAEAKKKKDLEKAGLTSLQAGLLAEGSEKEEKEEKKEEG